jgi:hypothetical protein
MEGKIKGKQIVDGTVVKSLNGSPGSIQYLIPSSDSNITLDIVTPKESSTHSFVVGWQGHLPLERGGLNNSDFTENEILITKTSSVISSGYKFNDEGKSSVDIWSASQIVNYIKSTKLVFNIGDEVSNVFHLVHNSGTRSVIVQIFKIETGESIETEIKRTDENSIDVYFNRPPKNNEFQVVIY